MRRLAAAHQTRLVPHPVALLVGGALVVLLLALGQSDLQRGAPIEADQIIGDLLARAQQAAIAVPLLQAAYASLSIYQNRRLAPAGGTG